MPLIVEFQELEFRKTEDTCVRDFRTRYGYILWVQRRRVQRVSWRGQKDKPTRCTWGATYRWQLTNRTKQTRAPGEPTISRGNAPEHAAAAFRSRNATASTFPTLQSHFQNISIFFSGHFNVFKVALIWETSRNSSCVVKRQYFLGTVGTDKQF